jgi:uncharacterized protein (TIGR02246 family)
MKIHFVVALAGLAIGFAVPTIAQQTKTPDPELRQQIDAYHKKVDAAYVSNDADAIAALYTEDAVLVTPQGTFFGQDAIKKYYTDLFKQAHFTAHVGKSDQYSPHAIGTAGDEIWATGGWAVTVQGQSGAPVDLKGFWGAVKVREGDGWKTRMETWNVTPAPAAAPSPTTTPSNK